MAATNGKANTAKSKKKKAAEKALISLMKEDRELFREVVLEAIEDFVLGELILEGRKDTKLVPQFIESLEDIALLRAMEEGRKSELVPREKLADLIKGKK